VCEIKQSRLTNSETNPQKRLVMLEELTEEKTVEAINLFKTVFEMCPGHNLEC